MTAITFRSFERSDYSTLARWRRDRGWLTWWGPARNEDELEDDYGLTVDGGTPTLMFIASENGRDVGLVELYKIADHPDWYDQVGIADAIGIDYGLGSSKDRGRGLGKAMVAQLIDEAFEMYPECSCVVAAPKTANAASCGLAESLGFTIVEVKHISGEWPEGGTSSIYKLERAAGPQRSSALAR